MPLSLAMPILQNHEKYHNRQAAWQHSGARWVLQTSKKRPIMPLSLSMPCLISQKDYNRHAASRHSGVGWVLQTSTKVPAIKQHFHTRTHWQSMHDWQSSIAAIKLDCRSKHTTGAGGEGGEQEKQQSSFRENIKGGSSDAEASPSRYVPGIRYSATPIRKEKLQDTAHARNTSRNQHLIRRKRNTSARSKALHTGCKYDSRRKSSISRLRVSVFFRF